MNMVFQSWKKLKIEEREEYKQKELKEQKSSSPKVKAHKKPGQSNLTQPVHTNNSHSQLIDAKMKDEEEVESIEEDEHFDQPAADAPTTESPEKQEQKKRYLNSFNVYKRIRMVEIKKLKKEIDDKKAQGLTVEANQIPPQTEDAIKDQIGFEWKHLDQFRKVQFEISKQDQDNLRQQKKLTNHEALRNCVF